MSRKARIKSESGTYHILVSGIDRGELFSDDQDREKYLSLLCEYSEVCGYELYAYCLLSNHIHLLINEGGGDISRVMKRLGTSYVYWFNNKYDRTGQLFEDRFKSEAVEDEEQFKGILRFIHQNPVQHLEADCAENFPWSSFNDYFTAGVVASDCARRIFGDNLTFQEYHKETAQSRYLDLTRKEKKISDEMLHLLIEKEYGLQAEQLLGLDQDQLLKILVQLLKSYDISVRQLGRVTGISLTTIWRLSTKAMVAETNHTPLK